MYRFLARSDHWLARRARRAYRAAQRFTLPWPWVVIKLALWVFLLARSVFYFLLRVCVCEPLFKAYCKEYGRGVRTGTYVHWVQGKGDLIVGDDVLLDGKSSFTFATRFSDRPTLRIGDHTGIGHGCTFTVGKAITIGKHCRLASQVWVFDSSGHPADPAARLAGRSPESEEVRPVVIGDNVWVGARSIIFPGVTLGDGCIVSAGAVVTGDVPPYTVVAGNPARRVGILRPSEKQCG